MRSALPIYCPQKLQSAGFWGHRVPVSCYDVLACLELYFKDWILSFGCWEWIKLFVLWALVQDLTWIMTCLNGIRAVQVCSSSWLIDRVDFIVRSLSLACLVRRLLDTFTTSSTSTRVQIPYSTMIWKFDVFEFVLNVLTISEKNFKWGCGEERTSWVQYSNCISPNTIGPL